MEDAIMSFVEEDASGVYNIRHRAFYFSKEVILFIKNQKYDRIYFSLFEQLIRSALLLGKPG